MSENREINLNISVTFRHTESTPAIKAHAEEKVSHCLNKYLLHDGDVSVVLLVEKRDHTAEINVLSKGYDIVAKAVTDDLYSAIDKALDNVERQLLKQKERKKNNKHHVVNV